MTETFYDILGVSTESTTAEIRAAYQDRLKESHPDVSDDADASTATRRVIRARDVLTDENERAKYDRFGHETYLKLTSKTADKGDSPSASAGTAAADTATQSPNERSSGTYSSAQEPHGTRNRRPGEGAARERAARERVDANQSTDASEANADTGATDRKATTDGGTTVGAGVGPISDPQGVWDGSTRVRGHATKQTDFDPNDLVPSTPTLMLLVLAGLLYPVMLFSAVFPFFPLVVNVVVGLCAVLTFAYLQSVPGAALVVFGVWSFMTPIAFLLSGVDMVSLLGVFAISTTLVPFGLSIVNYSIVRG